MTNIIYINYEKSILNNNFFFNCLKPLKKLTYLNSTNKSNFRILNAFALFETVL